MAMDDTLEARLGRIWGCIVINVYHFEAESTKVVKLAEAITKGAKNYRRMVSEYRLIIRQQRVWPVAANFFDDYFKHVDRENVPCLQHCDRTTIPIRLSIR